MAQEKAYRGTWGYRYGWVLVGLIAIAAIWGLNVWLRSPAPIVPLHNARTHLTTTTVVVVTPTTANPSGGPQQPPPCAFEGGHDNC